MILNIQMTPAPDSSPFDESPRCKRVQLLARDDQGEQARCENCEGNGVLPGGEGCRKCRATGIGRFFTALRLDLLPHEYDQAAAWIETLPRQGFDGYKVQRTIQLAEIGGGLTNTGSAVIIAGLNGEPLPAVYGVPRCGMRHAVFYVHAAFRVTYSQHRGIGSGVVEMIGIDRQVPRSIGIQRTKIWSFEDHGLGQPEMHIKPSSTTLYFPTSAVEAAMRKARTYHCRSAFYASTGGARGPSGALRGAGASPDNPAGPGMPSPLKGPGIGY